MRVSSAEGRNVAKVKTEKPGHPGKRLVLQHEWAAIGRHFGLTRREGEVLRLVFSGQTCEAIARQLQIRVRTVRQYLQQLHLKLAVQDRVNLVLLVIECRDQLRD